LIEIIIIMVMEEIMMKIKKIKKLRENKKRMEI
jgi:hypothetical protein